MYSLKVTALGWHVTAHVRVVRTTIPAPPFQSPFDNGKESLAPPSGRFLPTNLWVPVQSQYQRAFSALVTQTAHCGALHCSRDNNSLRLHWTTTMEDSQSQETTPSVRDARFAALEKERPRGMLGGGVQHSFRERPPAPIKINSGDSFKNNPFLKGKK